MFYYRNLRLIIICILAVFLCGVGISASQAEGGNSGAKYIVDQSVSLSFKPLRAFLLIEGDSGLVEHYSAVFVSRAGPEYEDERDGQLQVGAVLPLGSVGNSSREVHFSFFFIGDDLNFAATAVKTWTRAKLKANNLSIKEMRESIDKLNAALHITKNQSSGIERELHELREKASSIAGIDDIVDLKMELASLVVFAKDSHAEKKRLQALVELARLQEDPPEISSQLRELSVHLKETAKATAMADRLNNRRRKAARSRVNKKIALVNRLGDVDARTLAKEAFKLRARRRQLEKRLNKGIDIEERDF